MGKAVHIGRNIKRIREIRGIKQEVVAIELDIPQNQVSIIEQSEEVEHPILEKIANVLGVSVEAIETFSEEMLVFHIQSMHDNATAYQYNFKCSYNPLDKVVELYERLLQAEREKTALKEMLQK